MIELCNSSLQVLIIGYILRLIEFGEIYCFFKRFIFVGCILALYTHLCIKEKRKQCFPKRPLILSYNLNPIE